MDNLRGCARVQPSPTPFQPQPRADERPLGFRSPFDAGPPGPLALRAAGEVMASLRRGHIGPGLPTSILDGPRGGKMFGVLVVEAPDGQLGFLKAFSGQLQRTWDVEGFVPPVFDRAGREQVEPAGEATVKGLTARVEEARTSAAWQEVARELATLRARHEAEALALRARHDANRAARRAERARLRTTEPAASEALRALDRWSHDDDVELRRERARWRAEREELEARRDRLRRRLSALERLRRIVSQRVSWQLYDTYRFVNARAQQVTLRALFAPRIPSSGTGDCAAPKLLVHALRNGLRPLELAEFWWGAPPPGGGRTEGDFSPPCRDKCEPLLSFLLEGVTVAPR
jgi:tRNA pseudouridine32 synthase / 23S rRNA pseudouridine746 synthase